MKKHIIIQIIVGLFLCLWPFGANASNGEYQYDRLAKRNPFYPRLPAKVKKEDDSKAFKKDRSVQPKQKIQPKKARIPRKTTPPEKKAPKFVITGLVWNSERPQAIVNAQVVDIGDTISEAQITAIRKTGIDVNFQGKTITIKP